MGILSAEQVGRQWPSAEIRSCGQIDIRSKGHQKGNANKPGCQERYWAWKVGGCEGSSI